MNYVILQHPGHNRVYYNNSEKLAIAELKLASLRLSTTSSNIEVIEIEGIRYLSITTEKIISEKDLQILSRLSFVFAIYILEKQDEKVSLIPVGKLKYEYLDNKISTLLKYHGKTNELFTRMMINVALLSSDFNYATQIELLDPVAGKGTTLFEGSVNGFNVYGIEIENKSVHETSVFFKKFLEKERFKHKLLKRRIYGTNKSNSADIQEFEYARSKQEFKSPENIKKFGVVCGNTSDSFNYFKKERFHLLVGDLPYGIVHGNTGEKKTANASRNPSELLIECLPAWYKVLKPGGAVVVAWNSFLISRGKLSDLFSTFGFQILSKTPYDEFEHMVDNSIKRDIVVAKKVKIGNS